MAVICDYIYQSCIVDYFSLNVKSLYNLVSGYDIR